MPETEKLTLTSDAPGKTLFMLGNEAIARGAIEAGIKVFAAYPGTPSSELSETLIRLSKELNFHAEWSVNEKVAFEVAFGASLCGVRTMTAMKMVGLNVAHDPLMSATYMGIVGGMVLVNADEYTKETMEDLETVVEIYDQTDWHRMLGDVYMKAGRLASALKQYRRALSEV